MNTKLAQWPWKIVHLLKRTVLRLAKWFAIVCLTVVLGFTAFALMLPPLAPWHTTVLHSEFTARRDSGLDFNGYLNLEHTLFKEMHTEIATWDQHKTPFIYSRFNAAGPFNQLAEGAPYNHSFRLTVTHPVGHALLIHGLTDSPYTMKAMAESLHARGFEVTVLRLPGHGTLPSMMAEVRLRDWTAALRIAARDVAARTPVGQPFYIGGYSSGATLALQYTLDALEDPSLRRPNRVLLMSPAIQLTKVAVFSEIIDAVSMIPIPVLEKARWQEVLPEYDPYKFNSFPVNATRQINRATRQLRNALQAASKSGRLANMPPVLTWQSVVDSTVNADSTVTALYALLKGPQHRLVLFDVNRNQALGSIQRPEARTLLSQLRQQPRAYTLDIVGNVDASSPRVRVQRIAPDNTETVFSTNLDWPNNVVSMSHVSVPFPADDPIYGFIPGSGRHGMSSLGSWLLRGENGAVVLPLGALTRLRSNPFWPLIDQDLGKIIAEDNTAKFVHK